MDHSVFVSTLAEDTLEFLIDGKVLLARERLIIFLLLLLRVMTSIDLMTEPLFVCLAHLLETISQGLANLLNLALLLLREEQVALTSDSSLQDAFINQLAYEFADGSLLELELGSQATDGDRTETLPVGDQVALQRF